MSSEADLSYAAVLDTSAFDSACDHIVNKTSEASNQIEFESAKIQSLLTDVPKVNLDFLQNIDDAEKMREGIGEAFAQINSVVRQNSEALIELNRMYGEASAEADKFANVPSMQEHYQELKQQKAAIKEVIQARNQAILSAKEAEKSLEKETESLLDSVNAKKQNANATQSLRQRIRELEIEAAMLRDAAQQEGLEIDKNSGRYREIIEELGRLRDIRGDIQAAGNVFANDENQIAGVIQGLTGLSGAFTAAQGAIGLFAGENEELNKIMLRVQALMSITMGLQQVQQTLNKDSTFSLVTLNKLKEYWNRLVGTGAAEEAAATVVTETNTAAEIANTAAATADTAARKGNNVETVAGAAAQKVNTAATNLQTTATTAGTVATKGMTAAMKGLKIAMLTTGIGALIVGIGYLVHWIMEASSASSKAAEKVKETNEMLKESRERYIKTSLGIKDYINRINEFKGSKRDEKKLLDEINSKYGEQFGYFKSLKDAKQQLIAKSEAYCKMMMAESKAQAILSKATEAYVNYLEVVELYKTKTPGSFQSRTQLNWERQAKEKKAKADYLAWERQYQDALAEVREIAAKNDFGGHEDLDRDKSSMHTPSFDPKEASRKEIAAMREYQAAVDRYRETANAIIEADNIAASKDALKKELAQSEANTKARVKAWEDGLKTLIQARKKYLHDVYMSKKGATESGWEESDEGKMSDSDIEKWIRGNNPELAKQYDDELSRILQNGADDRINIVQKYNDQLVDKYGTLNERIALLERKRIDILNNLPVQYQDEAERQLDATIAALKGDDFKAKIDWSSVFGDMGKQSAEVLKYNLEKIKKYFEANKEGMGVEEIKEYEDAIKKLEDEIASRNPFAMLHKSLSDIEKAKTAYTTALNELTTAHNTATDARKEYNKALAEQNELAPQKDENGNLTAETEEYKAACERTANALVKLNKAEKDEQKSEQGVLKARNELTAAYAQFAAGLQGCGGVVKDLGGKAQKLAAVFSDDIADSIGKAVDFTSEVLDATSTVIQAIGDVSKGVAKSVTATVEAAAQGSTAAAAAGAGALSTIEKASIILTVLSAALTLATAIANLFNSDGSKQKEIEKLQVRIDQLQWELDNAETTRLQENVGKAIDKLRLIYAATEAQVLSLHGVMKDLPRFAFEFTKARYETEIFTKSVERLADAYAAVDYTSDKLLGGDKWSGSRAQLENYAQQMILVNKQLEEESSKKKSDDGKIQDYANKIEEIGQKMAEVINSIMEEIIGYTAEDLASTLGDAFIEAAKTGEDAMKAWGDTVNDIVADIMKRMLITEMLEKPIGQVFDKYRKKWFSDNGDFLGIDAVKNSMTSFSSDLYTVGESFNAFWDLLDENTKKMLGGDEAEREGASRGIATASQDSVDENNARLTTIQGHTYTLVQGMNELNQTSNAMLERLTGIENNTKETNQKLDTVSSSVKHLRDTVDEIKLQGVKIR